MKGRGKGKQWKVRNILLGSVTLLKGAFIFAVLVGVSSMIVKWHNLKAPEELLSVYMDCISKKEYEKMYEMLDVEASGNISREDFIKRNSAIYEGIEMKNLKITLISYQRKKKTVVYQTSFDTVAGKIRFRNEAVFKRTKDGYKMVWKDSLIFPDLESSDKVRVSTTKADRGEILDRNGRVLAGEGLAFTVGIVPGELEKEDREETFEEMSRLLDIDTKDIEKKLSAVWVKDDSFVPIKTISKVEDIDFLTTDPGEDLEKQKELQEKLARLPGVMLSDTGVREYPFGESAAHLIGYVQEVTAQDLEEHEKEGYREGSVIGRSGIEALYEKELKGQEGSRIYIIDSEGNEKKELANKPVQNGQSIKLTIDVDLQNNIYEQFKEDKSCTVAMDPKTGEVLALVSTPSYNNNDFILGLSQEKWTALNEDEKNPLYNRFRQVWCPGSSFKPVVAAIGLDLGIIDPDEDYGSEGLSWQKDSSWGSYQVTTLHTYKPVILENALIYSDNIYFAKAALKIGAKNLENALTELGFGEELPFEINMAKSGYSNAEHIETEIQLADSGYGQGEILVNPLHLASIYSAFFNQGNIVKPYLLNEQEKKTEYWIKEAFSRKTSQQVLEGMKKVVNDPYGTGYAAHRDNISLAGKTGTAEIKASKEDTFGTELGWFAVATTDETEEAEEKAEQSILMISMTEDVKDRGGSGYVVEKANKILENWFQDR